MKLIREEIESVDFIVEEKNGKKSMFIEGIFLQGDLKNRNGRMYPMDTLRAEVARYNENHVAAGRALGELGHPDGPTVNLDRVSHKIISLKESGSNFIGKAKISCLQLQQISLLIHLLLMLLLKASWKEKSGFGMEVFLESHMLRRPTRESTLLSPKDNLMRKRLNYSMIFSITCKGY